MQAWLNGCNTVGDAQRRKDSSSLKGNNREGVMLFGRPLTVSRYFNCQQIKGDAHHYGDH